MTVKELIIELMDGDLNREVHLCIPQDVTESDSKTGVTSRTTGVIFDIDNVEHHSGTCYLNFTDWRTKNESVRQPVEFKEEGYEDRAEIHSTCPNCKEYLDNEKWSFCPYCGTPIEWV